MIDVVHFSRPNAKVCIKLLVCSRSCSKDVSASKAACLWTHTSMSMLAIKLWHCVYKIPRVSPSVVVSGMTMERELPALLYFWSRLGMVHGDE